MSTVHKHIRLLGLALALLCTGCRKESPDQAGLVASDSLQRDSKTVFDFEDPRGDDRGMGHYVYPVPLQSQKEGIFDLRRFKVLDHGDRLEFILTFRRPVDSQTLQAETYPKGFAYQLIDIYIDKDRQVGSGLNEALPGRNLSFREDEAWDKAIVITPGSSHDVRNSIHNQSDLRQFWLKRNDIYVANDVYAGTYEIVARIPKSEVGQPHSKWGWQVVVMGYDPQNQTRYGLFNREVLTFATSKAFGGGTDYQGETNAIDVLAPTRESQYKVLSRYRSGPVDQDNTWAILPMIYAQNQRKDKQKMPQGRRNGMSSESVEVLREPDLRGIEPRYREGMQ